MKCRQKSLLRGGGLGVIAVAALAVVIQWCYVVSVWRSYDAWGIMNYRLCPFFPLVPLFPADLVLVVCIEHLRRNCTSYSSRVDYLIAKLILQFCAASVLIVASASPLWSILRTL